MKYLKKFENGIYHNTGDYIKCINNFGVSKEISIGSVYKIENIVIDTTVEYAIIYNDNNRTGIYRIFKLFIDATPEEIKIYNTKKDTEKYNL